MSNLLKIAVVLAAFVPPTAYADDQNWFVSHVGKEICVPLDDVDVDNPGQRLYYHTGEVHSAKQYERMIRRMGFIVKEEPPVIPGKSFNFLAIFGDQSTEFILFNDEGVCRDAMNSVEP